MFCEDVEVDQGVLIVGMKNILFDFYEIDCFDWCEFEKWGGYWVSDIGIWKILLILCVGDGGLDIYLEYKEWGDIVFVQCKYIDDYEKLMGYVLVWEVLYVVICYDVSKGY